MGASGTKVVDHLINSLHFLKLLRIGRLGRELEALTSFDAELGLFLSPVTTRVFKLTLLFFLSVHIVGCAYYFVANHGQGDNHGSDQENDDDDAGTWSVFAPDLHSAGPGRFAVAWLNSYYMALITISGSPLPPSTADQVIRFCLFHLSAYD